MNLSYNNKIEKKVLLEQNFNRDIRDKYLKIELSWFIFINFFTLLNQNAF